MSTTIERSFPFHQASKLLVIDGLNMNPNEYAEYSARFMTDLNDLRKKIVIMFPAHFTIKGAS